ncbi:uncharacterized protein LOC123674498 isoform X2 [Harmonia axyridis]|uniref:uncharacterized protein LOC123674498 isoform X2 n=1 Tax=Harmonia axyridis TaxID=115357 RepID=UPI001E279B15|nr:uncharacterized protein LOC123674498 isoform X2 [Harmonia axyridis]
MASRLADMQARFQQKQMQEREEKLLKLYESQQQRAFDRVGRGSAGSNTSIGSTGGGKVRQMFEERRQRAGIDKSYPLEPLNGKSMVKISNGQQPVVKNSRKTVQATVQRSVTHIRNGKPLINKRETIQKIYDNNNGVEKFETNHYNENLLDGTDSLVDLMNRNNIYDNLDDEESPPLETVEDDLSFMGKLSNVGGVPPSKNSIAAIASTPPKKVKQIITETRRSPPAKIVRKSVVKSDTPSRRSNPSSQTPSRSGSSSNSSPVHSITKMAATAKPNVSSPVRSPSNTRPSSKQAAPRAAMSSVVRDDLQECSYCGRRFATDRINKHEDVCGKTAKKQRKAYDAFKHRVQGTEIEQFVVGGKKKGGKVVPKKTPAVPIGQSKKNWRRTHEEFIATIRAAKVAQAHLASGGKLSDLPPPPPSSNPDYVQCPSCGRRFNEAAAQRHIPKCATYEFNKPKAGAARKR